MGTDGVQFARAGAKYVGVDLTPAGAALTYQNLALRGLPACAFVGSAETLPLADASVDLIYSHGVIHHTPSTEKAIHENWRVLKPGGRLHLMVYHKNSYNYYVSIMLLRRLGAILLLLPGGLQLAHRLTGEPIENLQIHRRRLRHRGVRYLFGPEWLSRNTDGPNNPLSRVYTRRTAKLLLHMFGDLRFEVVNINKRHIPLIGSRLSVSTERKLASVMGWHLHIFAKKAC